MKQCQVCKNASIKLLFTKTSGIYFHIKTEQRIYNINLIYNYTGVLTLQKLPLHIDMFHVKQICCSLSDNTEIIINLHIPVFHVKHFSHKCIPSSIKHARKTIYCSTIQENPIF